MSRWRDSFRRLGLGRAIYTLWHAPRASLARSRREGGPWQQWIDRRGRESMMRAAAHLPPLPPAGSDAPEVRFLTGRRFWYQTAFCAWSLAHHCGRPFRIVLFDDGSIDADLAHEAQRLFPGVRIVSRTEAETRLERVLPTGRFPALRGQRITYIHLRKLTDCHAGEDGWHLVLDSDMLFFRRPDALLRWTEKPVDPVHMLDVFDSYGYPADTLRRLAGRPLPARVNVGICGLRSDAIDWPRLEAWCAELLATHGTSYYLEQALVALLLANETPCVLPAADYRLMPDDAECRAPTAALHHYVDLSKRGYFRHAWKHTVSAAQIRPS